MAAFSVTGRKSPGHTFTVTNATKPGNSDKLKLHDINQTISEWIRCGVIRFVGTSGSTHTYHMMGNPEMVGTQAGG